MYFFSSKNCRFCELARPHIEDLEKKYADNGVQVIEIDVDENRSLVEAAEINAWPKYIFAVDGKIVGQDDGWDNPSKFLLEDRLGLIRKYNVWPGLLMTYEEMEVLSQDKQPNYRGKSGKADPRDPDWIEKEQSSEQRQSSCGDSAHQTAALAEGIQDLFNELEKKLDIMNRATQSHIDGAISIIDVRLDEFNRMSGGAKCDCGKK